MNTQPDTLNQACESLRLSVSWEFVPFSRSRNAGEKTPSLNWRYSLERDGKEILTGDYMQGAGHCPAYKASVKYLGDINSVLRDSKIREECETGKTHVNTQTWVKPTKLNPPSLADLVYCLVSDASAIDHPTFESWADEYGYDSDSRKGEALYRQCLEIALKLRAAIGDSGLEQLRNASQDY